MAHKKRQRTQRAGNGLVYWDGKMRPVSGKRGVKIILDQGKNACNHWCQVQMGLDNDGTP